MRTATARMSGGTQVSEAAADLGIEAVMARLARREPAALADLVAAHGPALGRAVGGVARSRGTRLTMAELDELVVDAALELAELAGSWDPSGAPPWIWARHRIGAVVDRHIGQYATSLDASPIPLADRPAAAPSPQGEPPTLDLVASLASRHPTVALLQAAVQLVATPRDQEVFFETALQATLGDRSPAVTVGRMLGLAPATVRQQHRRVRLRVLHLVDQDPRFASLGGIAMLGHPAA